MAAQPCMKVSFTNTKILWLWAHVDPRIIHEDWQPIDFSCCFCTWPRNSTWQNACHIGKGRSTRHLVSEIKEHIARASAKFKSWCNTDPFFYIFYKNINYLCVHWKHLARRFQWTQKKRAYEILVLPIKSKTRICAQSWQSLPLSHTDNLGA